MYVTRPLSLYSTSPGAAATAPPGGPHSGYLVVQDVEFEAQARCCWGLCRNPYLSGLPFPQNRLVTVEYTTRRVQNPETPGVAETRSTYDVFFIPVPDQPLSSNRYYVVRAQGTHAGKVCTCSREEDKTNCCFCSCVNDVKPLPFRDGDIYQQVEVVPRRSSSGKFYARAVAPDGFPPHFLRRKGWKVYTSLPRRMGLEDLGDAQGVDDKLRARLPAVDFPVSSLPPPGVVVGKWYCPFIFVKEDCSPKEQMKRSVFYEMTLEQFWEAVHTCENVPGGGGRAVQVSVGDVRRESALLRGSEPVGEEAPVEVDGVAWFRPAKAAAGGGGVGLSAAVVARMRWEAERGGWAAAGAEVAGLEREVEYTPGGDWGRFGCYVLVERFALKRTDGSLVLTYDFKHVNKIIIKWE